MSKRIRRLLLFNQQTSIHQRNFVFDDKNQIQNRKRKRFRKLIQQHRKSLQQ